MCFETCDRAHCCPSRSCMNNITEQLCNMSTDSIVRTCLLAATVAYMIIGVYVAHRFSLSPGKTILLGSGIVVLGGAAILYPAIRDKCLETMEKIKKISKEMYASISACCCPTNTDESSRS